MRRKGAWLEGVVACVLILPILWTARLAPFEGTSALAADPIEIRAIAAWPLTCNCVSQYKRYVDEVNKRARGQVKIRLLGGPEVVAAFEQFQALRTGIADMTHTAGGYFVGETIEGSIMDLLDPTDFNRYLKGLRGTDAMQIVNQAYGEKSKVRFLGIMVGGTGFRFLMAKSISSLDDLKGTRIRVFGSQGAKAVQFFRGSPQTIPANELYTALQRGVVDGAIRAPDDAWSFGERDVYKSMIATPLQLAPGGIYIATRVWEKLPQDAQRLLSSVATEMEPGVLNYFAQSDAKAIENLKAQGMRVVEVSGADRKRLSDARNVYWDELVAKSPVFGSRLRAMLEPYTK